LDAPALQLFRGGLLERFTLFLAGGFGLPAQIRGFLLQGAPALFTHPHGFGPRICNSLIGLMLGGIETRHKRLFVTRDRLENRA